MVQSPGCRAGFLHRKRFVLQTRNIFIFPWKYLSKLVLCHWGEGLWRCCNQRVNTFCNALSQEMVKKCVWRFLNAKMTWSLKFIVFTTNSPPSKRYTLHWQTEKNWKHPIICLFCLTSDKCTTLTSVYLSWGEPLSFKMSSASLEQISEVWKKKTCKFLFEIQIL